MSALKILCIAGSWLLTPKQEISFHPNPVDKMGTVDQLPHNKGHNAEVVHLVQILFGRYRIVAVDTALGFTLV